MLILLTGNTCFKIANFREGLVRALVARGCDVVVLAPTDSYRPKLEVMGCEVHDVPMDRNGTALLAELALLWRIFSFLRHERPTVVFSYTIKNNIYAGLACRWLGIPFVPNVTGLGPAFNQSGPLNKIIQMLYLQAFARARVVFFQNPDDREVFLAAGLVAIERTRLLHGSGVDLNRFAASDLPPETNGVIFVLVSRLLWDKGVGLYVEAARVLRARNPAFRFQLLGPVDSASRSGIPMAQIDAWVQEGVVEYLGETQDVRPTIAAAHCVVLPTWYHEGTPRVLLEAAAMARAVITTNRPGCRDAVVDGKTGLLCAAQNLDSLIETLVRFAVMPPSEKIEMSVAARARAEAEFSEERVIDAYFEQLT